MWGIAQKEDVELLEASCFLLIIGKCQFNLEPLLSWKKDFYKSDVMPLFHISCHFIILPIRITCGIKTRKRKSTIRKTTYFTQTYVS